MATHIQSVSSSFQQDALSFFTGLIDDSEVAEIDYYKKANISDYVKTNICFEYCCDLEETKEEWKERVLSFEEQYNVRLDALKRCFSMGRFSTVIQNDYGNDLDGSKDFFVYVFYWVKNKKTKEANYVISGIRVEFDNVIETKGWFGDGVMLNHKITKHFIHCLARETIIKLEKGIM